MSTPLIDRPRRPDLVDALTRREFAALLAASGLLAGCGGTGTDEQAAATRSVRHPLGTTDIPIQPERIVVSGVQGIAAGLLDLGRRIHAAVPNNTTDAPGPWNPDLADRLRGTIEIGARGAFDFDLEEVAAARPDLILHFAASLEETYAQLSGIAPTVAVEPAAGSSFYYGMLRDVARILGAPERAEELIGEIDATTAALRARVTPGAVSIAQLSAADNIGVYGPGSWIADTVTALGGTVVPDGLAFDGGTASISLEELSMLSGDTLLLVENTGELGDAGTQRAFRQELERGGLYPTLPAVRAGRVVVLEQQRVSGGSGLKGYRHLLDQLTATFVPAR